MIPFGLPEVLVQVAAAAGIPEQDVRRAMWDMASEKTAEPHSFASVLRSGTTACRAGRGSSRRGRQRRPRRVAALEQGLKLRRKTELGSLWDPGDELGSCAGR